DTLPPVVVADIEKMVREPQVDPLVQKCERARSTQEALKDAIDAYAKRHNVSKSVAADMVILRSPTLNEHVKLEKSLRGAYDREFGLGMECRRDHGVEIVAAPVGKGCPAGSPKPMGGGRGSFSQGRSRALDAFMGDARVKDNADVYEDALDDPARN